MSSMLDEGKRAARPRRRFSVERFTAGRGPPAGGGSREKSDLAAGGGLPVTVDDDDDAAPRTAMELCNAA
eukprot:gene32088-53732_t